MKILLPLFILLFTADTAPAQQVIKLEDVSKHIGDSVKVCSKVSGIRYLENAKDQPTFINLGGSYPNQLLTIVIWADTRARFEKSPEELFTGKEICVTGRVELFREKPQIVVKKKEQIAEK